MVPDALLNRVSEIPDTPPGRYIFELRDEFSRPFCIAKPEDESSGFLKKLIYI